ncbi:MAG TPA: P1 family peptidase [Gemmatimonadales bacterium]|nr:P1 family peptidase [Gemmatimonadales bacterium]
MTKQSMADKKPVVFRVLRGISWLSFGYFVLLLGASLANAQTKPRGRDLGIPFPGTPGPHNAITDVAGVAVGHATIMRGSGRLVPHQGPVRTGVTAILTRPRGDWAPVFAATFNGNGNGDMTGTNWIAESGFLEGPILLTGTHSVGTVRDAVIQWELKNGRQFQFTYPVVAETFDFLSDANGEHVKQEHAFAALDSARPGKVTEGAVGGGTGMGCNGWKGGIGTSSRKLGSGAGDWTVGVLVQCNYGGSLQVLGVPIVRPAELGICRTADSATQEWVSRLRRCASGSRQGQGDESPPRGSIVVIVATDAPLLPHQLARLARRVPMALGHLGSWASNFSGDLFLAFSTANHNASQSDTATIATWPNESMDPLFRAVIEATEESVVNAMLAAETMEGADGVRVSGLPGSLVVDALKKAGRMQ